MTDIEVWGKIIHTFATVALWEIGILFAWYFLLGVVVSLLSFLENKTLTPEELKNKRAGYRTYKKGPGKPTDSHSLV